MSRPTLPHPSWILALLLAATPLPYPVLEAQETESALSPAGRLRIEVAPSFVSWDHRFGLRVEGGSVVEELEPLGFDLDRPDASALFAGVPDLEAALRSSLDDPDFSGSLGGFGAVVSADRIRIPFRLDVGVFDRLTVGVTVPMVKSRTEISFAFDSAGANLGASPALTDPGLLASWADGMAGSATSAAQRASELCASDPSSVDCQDASRLAEDLAAFQESMYAAYAASLLFPTASSAAGQALLERAAELDQRLEDAGLAGVPSSLPLGAPVPDRAAFDALVEQAFATPPLANRVGLWELGDVELHAVLELLEGALRDSAGAPARARWQVGVGGLVRLGTGTRDDPAVVFDYGTGDGQTDLEGRVFANLAWGRVGLWTDVRYGVQRPTTLPRRVGPPDVVFVAPGSLTEVEWTPGDYLRLEIAPRFHLTQDLAFSGGYRLWSKADDRYERVGQPAAGEPLPPYQPAGPLFTDASLLALETEETRQELGLGLVYDTLEAWREGRAPLPLEGRFTVRWAVAGSGGRTPETFQTQISFRLYQRLWGG